MQAALRAASSGVAAVMSAALRAARDEAINGKRTLLLIIWKRRLTAGPKKNWNAAIPIPVSKLTSF